MTMTSPLRGPKSPEGGGFAAAHLLARRAGYGPAPPAPRLLRIACGDGLRPVLTPETTAALGPGRAGRPRPARALRAARKPAVAGTRTPAST